MIVIFKEESETYRVDIYIYIYSLGLEEEGSKDKTTSVWDKSIN